LRVFSPDRLKHDAASTHCNDDRADRPDDPHLLQTNSQTRSPRSEDTAGVDVGLRGTIAELETRREIEVAIGVLMGLRGCSHREAVNEYLDAVHETGTRAPALGRLDRLGQP
jgi:hypothetical protein